MRNEYASGKTIEATVGYIAKLTEAGDYEVMLTNAFREAVNEAVKNLISEPLVVTDTDGTLNKTWQQIADAFPNVYITYEDVKACVAIVSYDGDSYIVVESTGDAYVVYVAASASGYPAIPSDGD